MNEIKDDNIHLSSTQPAKEKIYGKEKLRTFTGTHYMRSHVQLRNLSLNDSIIRNNKDYGLKEEELYKDKDGIGVVDDNHDQSPLAEFEGSGGGVGIFKVPARAPLHPDRPTYLEIRPHPLKETQVTKCVFVVIGIRRKIGCDNDVLVSFFFLNGNVKCYGVSFFSIKAG